jgi:hypothetical protein
MSRVAWDVLKRVQLTALLSDSASDSAIRFLAILKSKVGSKFYQTPPGTSATAHPEPPDFRR